MQLPRSHLWQMILLTVGICSRNLLDIKQQALSESALPLCSNAQCAELYVGLLAVMKAGGCYVPIDHTLPAARVQSMLEQAGCILMLTHAGVEALPALTASLSKIFLSAAWDSLATRPRTNPCGRCSVTDPAYILFTSGELFCLHMQVPNYLLQVSTVPQPLHVANMVLLKRPHGGNDHGRPNLDVPQARRACPRALW